MFAALLLSASLSLAGDCGDCAQGRQGLFARRAERKAARSAQACATTAEVVSETVQQAEIRTTSKQSLKTITGPVKKSVTIVPVGSAKSVAPATSK
jgi:hypothetical protein